MKRATTFLQLAKPLFLSAVLLSLTIGCTPSKTTETESTTVDSVGEAVPKDDVKQDAAKEETPETTELPTNSSEKVDPSATASPTTVSPTTGSPVTTSVPTAPAAAPTTTPAAPAQTPSSIVISESSIGALDSTTPFNLQAVQSAFPGMTITEDSFSAEGVTYPAIKVSAAGTELLTITPKIDESLIEEVTTNSPQVANALGHDIGTSFSDIFTADQASGCLAGVDAYMGKAMCFAPNTQNIQYVFSGSDGGSSFGQLPSADVLSSWTLTEIRWWPS
ncbi:MAG: DUF1131 family protein [Cyanobacteria bacterium J06649_4]